MATPTLRRLVVVALTTVGLLLWLGSLLLLARTSQDHEQFGQWYNWLFLLNLLGAAVLLVLIVANLARLVREYRNHIPGSRLKSRMVAIFVVLAMLPLLLVYYFSVQFLNRGIDSWFNVEVQQGLDDALTLSRATLELQMRDNLERTRQMADSLTGWRDQDLAAELAFLRRESGASEVTVTLGNSRIIATSSARTDVTVPAAPTEEVLLQIRQGRPFVSLDPMANGDYSIRTATGIPVRSPVEEARILQAVWTVAPRITSLANSVEGVKREYDNLTFFRGPLKTSLTLTLTLVLLLSLLAAVWGAFFAARRLVAPIQNLIAGTRAVAKGDFDTRLPLPGRDELGFLVNSFNDMTTRLAEARELARRSQYAVENERSYLEVILGRLSTGVVSLEPDWRIRTANEAASAILGVDMDGWIGRPLTEVAEGRPLLEQLVEVGRDHLSRGEREWREQMVLQGDVGRRVLMCACSALPSDGETPAGYVVVFDDITALLQAQRDAAWGEVARRLAHEIKNPLTPIQLSAERMRRRFLDAMDEQDAQIMERATRTIVQQVEAMKQMVNAFSEYARAPDMSLARLDINRLITEVVDLYRVREIDVDIDLDLDPELHEIEVDPGRIRQILHNLIRNAVEALDHKVGGRMRIATRLDTASGHRLAHLDVEDNGPGFPLDAVEQVFDPYVTSKPKGTGLGLAIVKKIVEEHGGRIEAGNADDGGAHIAIVLPADEEARTAMMRREVRAGEYRRERA